MSKSEVSQTNLESRDISIFSSLNMTIREIFRLLRKLNMTKNKLPRAINCARNDKAKYRI
ncbi:hypothetical protein [Helicobacter sp. T3_23-1059]